MSYFVKAASFAVLKSINLKTIYFEVVANSQGNELMALRCHCASLPVGTSCEFKNV